MSLQLDKADVRLLLEGLRAWIAEPLNGGLLSMMARAVLRPKEDESGFQSGMMEQRGKCQEEKAAREREARVLLETLQRAADVGGALQFTMHELLLLENALSVFTVEAARQDMVGSVMKAMLFGQSAGPLEAKVQARKTELQEQRARLRVIPTAYKLVMAINAASEHECEPQRPI